MPVAKIHVLEGRYNEARLGKVSSAVQDGLISALGIPPEDFFQIIHVRLHAVSPCLIANTFTFASARVRRCRPLWNAPQRKPLPAPTASR